MSFFKNLKFLLLIIYLIPLLVAIALFYKFSNIYPYFHDAVSYNYLNIKASMKAENFGTFVILKQEILSNGRNILAVVPYIIFPTIAKYKIAHLATSLPFFIIFIYSIYSLIKKITKKKLLAILLSFFIFFIPGLYNPTKGIIGNNIDINVSFVIGISIVYFLKWNFFGKKKHFYLFLLFSLLPVYLRFASIVYLSVIYIGFLLIILIKANLKSLFRKFSRKDFFCIFIIILIFSPYIFFHLKSVIMFYKIYGYGLNNSIFDSSKIFIYTLGSFLGVPIMILLIFLYFFFFKNFFLNDIFDLKSLFIINLSVVLPIFNIFILKTTTTPVHIYSFVNIYISMILFVVFYFASFDKVIKKIFLIFFVIICFQLIHFNSKISNPPKDINEKKFFDMELANNISNFNQKNIVWLSVVDESFAAVSVESFYRNKKFILPAGQDFFFSNHKTVFLGNFPNKSNIQITKSVMNNVNKYVDIIIVHKETNTLKNYFNNDVSFFVSKKISLLVKSDSNWIFIKDILHPKYGKVSIYKNSLPLDNNFNDILFGQIIFN
jgi:hypothetical protein